MSPAPPRALFLVLTYRASGSLWRTSLHSVDGSIEENSVLETQYSYSTRPSYLLNSSSTQCAGGEKCRAALRQPRRIF